LIRIRETLFKKELISLLIEEQVLHFVVHHIGWVICEKKEVNSAQAECFAKVIDTGPINDAIDDSLLIASIIRIGRMKVGNDSADLIIAGTSQISGKR
jgi:hypothetical protein